MRDLRPAHLAAAHGDRASPAINDSVENLLRGAQLRQEREVGRLCWFSTAVVAGGASSLVAAGGGFSAHASEYC